MPGVRSRSRMRQTDFYRISQKFVSTRSIICYISVIHYLGDHHETDFRCFGVAGLRSLACSGAESATGGRADHCHAGRRARQCHDDRGGHQCFGNGPRGNTGSASGSGGHRSCACAEHVAGSRPGARTCTCTCTCNRSCADACRSASRTCSGSGRSTGCVRSACKQCATHDRRHAAPEFALRAGDQ